MSDYYQLIEEFNKINNTSYTQKNDYSKYTQVQEKDYLPFPYEGFATKAIHTGSSGADKIHGSVNIPIHLSSTYVMKNPVDPMSEFFYTRLGNPNRTAFEQCMSDLEFGKYSIAFSSGLGTVANIMHQFKTGDHVICSEDVYGGVHAYLTDYSKNSHNLEVDFMDLTKIENIKKALKKNTVLVWLESPSNPTLKIIDIKETCKIIKEFNKDIIIVADNTFQTPYLASPLLLGADIVMHSASKYIGGHSDLIMGVLVTSNKEIYEKILNISFTVGSTPSAFDCYLALRGLKSLESRMKTHSYNAYCLAHYLRDHDKIENVIYPGFSDHPQRELILRQQRGFTGMISFEIKGGNYEQASQFLKGLKIVQLATSLGGVETLGTVPAFVSHRDVPKEHREYLGMTDSFVRFSVGIENINDIIADVEQSLEKIVIT